MNNQPLPTSSVPPQPAATPDATPIASGNRPWLLLSLAGAAILTLGIAIGVFGARFLSQSQIQPQLPPIPTSTLSQLPTSTPTPDLYREPNGSTATADWKTYTDIDSSLTFKYPNDWQAEKESVFGSRTVVEFRYQNNPLLELTALGNYNQMTGTTFRNLDEYLGLRKSKAISVTIADNYPAKKIIDQGDPGHVIPYEEVLFFSSDNKFIISFYYKPSYYDMPQSVETLDLILSTFKFTD